MITVALHFASALTWTCMYVCCMCGPEIFKTTWKIAIKEAGLAKSSISITKTKFEMFFFLLENNSQYFPFSQQLKIESLPAKHNLKSSRVPIFPLDLYAWTASADMALLPPISPINQLCLPFMRVRLNICL